MIKLESLLKEDENEEEKVGKSEEELKDALEAMKEMYDKVDKAFSGFKGEFEFGEPHIGEYVDHKGHFVSDITRKIYIADLIFEFKIKISDSFSRNNLKLKTTFVHRGNTQTEMNFTIEHAQELLKATEIANKLKSEAEDLLGKIVD